MFKLKSRAFTLAEVLISLGLIGVLSTVAIQVMQKNDHVAEFDALRNKAIMNIQGSVHSVLYDEKVSELVTQGESKNVDTLLAKVMDGLNVKGLKTTTGKWVFAEDENIKDFYGMRDGVYFAFVNNDGTDTTTAAVSRVAIDVNAEAGPNATGMDQVLLYMDRFGNLQPGKLPPAPECLPPRQLINQVCACPAPKTKWVEPSCLCPDDKPYEYNGTCNQCQEGQEYREGCGCINKKPDDEQEYELIDCEWVPVTPPPAFDCQKEGGIPYEIDGETYCYEKCDSNCNKPQEKMDYRTATCKLPKVGAYALQGNEYSLAASGQSFSVPCWGDGPSGGLVTALSCAREPAQGLWKAFDESKRFSMLDDAQGDLRYDFFEPSLSNHAYGYGCQYVVNNAGAGFTDAEAVRLCRDSFPRYIGYNYLGWPASNRDGYMNAFAERLLKNVDGAIDGINQERVTQRMEQLKNPECVEKVCPCPNQPDYVDIIPKEMDDGNPDITRDKLYLFVSAKYVGTVGANEEVYDIVVYLSLDPNGSSVFQDITKYQADIQVKVADKWIRLQSLIKGKNPTWFSNKGNRYQGLTPGNMSSMISITSANLGDIGYKYEVKGWSNNYRW